jgi:HK97 family phage major capsid protein
MRVLERTSKAGDLPDHAATTVERMLGTPDGSWTARWAVATGDEAYRSAFVKLMGDPERGHLLWDAREQEAFRRVAAVQAEQRAMGESAGGTGGYMIPLVLDPAIMLSSDGSANPLRQISRVVQTTGSQWTGVTSQGVSAEWVGEGNQVADASPTLTAPNIPVHKGDSFIPYSFEVGMDAPNFLAEIQKLLVDAADQLMSAAYTTGTGTGQPKGIVTALAGTASEINGSGTEALVSADVYTLQSALGPRFQPNAKWTANLSILNALRQFETANGSLKFPSLQDVPPHLLGRPVFENSNQDGSINPAVTASNFVVLYGDFSNFVIVDRIGSTLELIPNLLSTTNGRPTGQRGALLWFRTGSDVVNVNGFRLLDVPTT